MKRTFRYGACILGAAVMAGCSKQPPEPPPAARSTIEPSAETNDAALAIDLAKAKALLAPDESLETISLDANGIATTTGRVDGYKSTAWAISVDAGQTLTVTLTSPNKNISFNLWDVNASDSGAIHRGELDGSTAVFTANAATTLLVRPGQPRAQARRNEGGDYELRIERR